MKKILFVSMVASLLFISCSNDKDNESSESGIVSCRYGDSDLPPRAVKLGNVCLEITVSILKESGYSVNDIKANCVGQFLNEVCPSGSVLKCGSNSEYPYKVVYLYDEQYKNMTCEEFWEL